jgi:hypothetical protein
MTGRIGGDIIIGQDIIIMVITARDIIFILIGNGIHLIRIIMGIMVIIILQDTVLELIRGLYQIIRVLELTLA